MSTHHPEIGLDEEERPEEDAPLLDNDEIKNLEDQIRERRRELSGDRKTYISIPGYDDIGLVAQYGLLDGKQLDTIGERVRRQTRDRVDRGLFMAIDTMIAACAGLFLDRGNSTYAPFDPNRTGMPFKYDKDLAEFCGFDADTARQVVQGLFGGNEAAIGAHAMRLNRWFQNTFRDVDEEFLGEL